MSWASDGEPDHPRECGANEGDVFTATYVGGSSPRVRGKRYPLRRRRSSGRIIPASAGQTGSQTVLLRRWADHPRECGANDADNCFQSRAIGSSPRVRGKPQLEAGLGKEARIIPASANNHETNACTRVCGSSPRVRGKPHMAADLETMMRIIPASAGQTRSHAPARGCMSDHPRECGANLSFPRPRTGPYGSSPRVRGKRSHQGHDHRRRRIIPASAGQTRCG